MVELNRRQSAFVLLFVEHRSGRLGPLEIGAIVCLPAGSIRPLRQRARPYSPKLVGLAVRAARMGGQSAE